MFAGSQDTILQANHMRYVFALIFDACANCHFVSQHIFYFPLRQRLEALLQVPVFRKLLEYEFQRPKPRDRNIMSDVYDGQTWKEFLGTPTTPLERIILHFCMDGFAPFQCGSLSMKPAMCSIFSLPPPLRMKAEFMMLFMLIPANIKGFALKKYFDYAARRELNHLYHTGVHFYILLHVLLLLLTALFHRDFWDKSQSFWHVHGHAWALRITR